MCSGCWAGTYGAPIISSDEVLVAAELIRRLYEDLGCPTGGPLHAMLDDMNIDDDQINGDYYTSGDYAKRATFEGVPDGTGRWVHHNDLKCTPEVKELCELILHAFRGMPASHRAAAIAWREGWIAAYFANLADVLRNAGSLPKAIPELVELLVADCTREMNAPPPQPGGTKECVSIPCPPFTGQMSGTVYPGPGQVFAPDAKITGPGVVESSVNSDGSANVTWTPPPEGLDLSDLFTAPGLVSMAPVMIDASGFMSGVVAFEPDYRAELAPEAAPALPPYLRYPSARCTIGPLHLAHPWPWMFPKYWCDAQPLLDTGAEE